MYKTYVCSSLFWEIPHYLIVNVYYMLPPPPDSMLEGIHYPPPYSMLGEVGRADQSPNQHWMGGVLSVHTDVSIDAQYFPPFVRSFLPWSVELKVYLSHLVCTAHNTY